MATYTLETSITLEEWDNKKYFTDSSE